MEWHQSLGLEPERLQFHQHTTEELAHYARAAFDIQFDFGGTLGFQEIEGVHNRGDFDLDAAPGVLGQEARVLRPAEQPALHAVRRRDVGRRRSHDARGARERVSRGDGRGRERGAHGARAASVARADQGGDLSAREEGRHAGDGAAHRRRPAPALPGVLRRVGRDRPALPPAGRSRHAVLHHGRWRVDARTAR